MGRCAVEVSPRHDDDRCPGVDDDAVDAGGEDAALVSSAAMVIDLVIVTAPKPPGSRQLISPPGAVFEIAPAKVLHGAVRLHGLTSSPTPETQVRVACALRGRGHESRTRKRRGQCEQGYICTVNPHLLSWPKFDTRSTPFQVCQETVAIPAINRVTILAPLEKSEAKPILHGGTIATPKLPAGHGLTLHCRRRRPAAARSGVPPRMERGGEKRLPAPRPDKPALGTPADFIASG